VVAMLEAIESLARARWMTRLELDAHTVTPTAIQALLDRARQRDVQTHLSWPTNTR